MESVLSLTTILIAHLIFLTLFFVLTLIITLSIDVYSTTFFLTNFLCTYLKSLFLLTIRPFRSVFRYITQVFSLHINWWIHSTLTLAIFRKKRSALWQRRNFVKFFRIDVKISPTLVLQPRLIFVLYIFPLQLQFQPQ